MFTASSEYEMAGLCVLVTRGLRRGSLKQVPRLRARIGHHAACRQAAAFALSLLYPRTLASLSLSHPRGCRNSYVFRGPSIPSPHPV